MIEELSMAVRSTVKMLMLLGSIAIVGTGMVAAIYRACAWVWATIA